MHSANQSLRWMRIGFPVLTLFAMGCRPAWAHDEKVSASDVQMLKREIVWKVDVGVVGLAKVIRFPAGSAELSDLRLQSVKGEIARYLGNGLSVEINGLPAMSEAGILEPVYEPFMLSGEPYIARVRQEFRFRSQQDVQRVSLGVRFFSEMTANHRAVLNVRWGDQQRQFVRIGPSHLEVTYARLHPTFWHTASDFLLWGTHHIFIGYDHIAFLLALLLGARRVWEMVKIVTSFTVAHSLTLLLAAMNLIRVQQNITESLIAASIVYVALENYFLKDGNHRWILTFFFGLVHGLGFSNVLMERLIDVSTIVVPVLSFNLGVELGQLVILLLAFPSMLCFYRLGGVEAREGRQRRLLRIGSAPLLILGLGWLIQRVFGLDFMPL